FTGVPAATIAHARVAAERGAALVVGTTGFDAAQERELRAIATRTRAVIAANYSVGITVLRDLVTRAARLLDPTFEAEIVELHHHSKKDAPSGTALALAECVAQGRQHQLDKVRVLARGGIVGPQLPHPPRTPPPPT